MSKRVLLTGAAGFIGFHLAKFLKKRGDFVIGYDNFNDYYSPALKRWRAEELQKVGVEVVAADICDGALLKSLLAKEKITHVVHFAAQAGVRYSLKNPSAYVKSNLEGLVQVLEACRHSQGVHLTFASSSSVYGLNTKIPFSPDDKTDQPANLYGATKKSGELLAFSYHHVFSLPIAILRFFTVYGPWGRPDMAYFAFTDAILSGRTIELFNNGQMKRDFTYIDDLIEGVAAAMDLGGGWEVFNLGNNRPVSLLDFVTILEEVVGKKAKKELLPMQPGEVVETFADINYSREKLHFSPKMQLKEGLSRFFIWYQDYAQHLKKLR